MLKQIFKEFWIQVVLSIIWVIYNEYTDKKSFDLASSVKNFGTCLFLTSWFLGQYLRIKKQRSVDNSLSEILKSTQEVITTQTELMQESVANVTGGDSFCYLSIGNINVMVATLDASSLNTVTSIASAAINIQEG